MIPDPTIIPPTTPMTSGTDLERPAWQRRWAAEFLSLPQDAGPDEARKAFARLLSRQDFVPSLEAQQALHVLLNSARVNATTTDSSAQAFLAEENARRTEVERFIDTFW